MSGWRQETLDENNTNQNTVPLKVWVEDISIKIYPISNPLPLHFLVFNLPSYLLPTQP